LIFKNQDEEMILLNCYCYDNFNKKIISLRGFECSLESSTVCDGSSKQFRG
jgi:hypothetical protein